MTPSHPNEVNQPWPKAQVEQNILYHYLPELELNRSKLDDDSSMKHLDLLINYIKTTYTPTEHSIVSLLAAKEITYDLLWALFKPGTWVYTTCSGTGKPRCVIYDACEEKTTKSGLKYCNMECRYLDFDGEVLGEVSIELHIPKFRGTKRINTLEAFPLQYHSNQSDVRTDLIKCGRKFISLMGSHHRHCRGKAFYIHEGYRVEFSVDSRIMVDAAFFRKINPNYSRPRITEAADMEPTDFSLLMFDESKSEPDHQVQSNGKGPADMKENDLLICSPTVYGFSFNDKIWGEMLLPVARLQLNWFMDA